MGKFKDIFSGPPICPVCGQGYLKHGFRINTIECNECGETFEFPKIEFEL